MKFKLLLFALFLTCSSCSSMSQYYGGGHWQPIVARDSLNTTDPCEDSLFLALQNKPYSSLTAYEQAYFQQKWNECNELLPPSNTPEWILTIFTLVGAFVAIIIAAS